MGGGSPICKKHKLWNKFRIMFLNVKLQRRINISASTARLKINTVCLWPSYLKKKKVWFCHRNHCMAREHFIVREHSSPLHPQIQVKTLFFKSRSYMWTWSSSVASEESGCQTTCPESRPFTNWKPLLHHKMKTTTRKTRDCWADIILYQTRMGLHSFMFYCK